jgi:tRNA (cmo5U34)-methyltransferase
MTLHHLLPAQKRRLYAAICRALRPGGRYIEGEYVVAEAEEQRRLAEVQRQARTEAAGTYHLDLPLSLATQQRLLAEAGFGLVDVIWHKGEAAVYSGQAQPFPLRPARFCSM